MAVKIFILGCPGSGKSKVTRHITKLIQSEGWSTVRFIDYDSLAHLIQTDLGELGKKNRFRYSKNQKDELIVIVIELRDTTKSDQSPASLVTDPPLCKTFRSWIPTNEKNAFFTLIAMIYLVFAVIHACTTGDFSMLTYLLGVVAGWAGVKEIIGKISQKKDKNDL